MARAEYLANNATSTLDGGITNSQTTLDVDDASAFPTEGDFRISVEEEIMLVTGVSSNTFTVVRAREGTSGVTHANGVTVTHILTAAGLEKHLQESVPLHGYSPPLRITDTAGEDAVVADFTWDNQETATADDVNGTILMTIPAAAAADARILYLAAPATPWVATGAFSFFHVMTTNAAGQMRGGLWIGESGTGEYITISALRNKDYVGQNIVVQRFNSTVSFNSEQYNTGGSPPGNTFPFPSLVWLQIEDNGTNLIYRVSPDGVNWTVILTESRTAFMAGGPDVIGFGGNASSGTIGLTVHCHHFSVE